MEHHSFTIICRRIGIPEPPLPILNATTHRPYVTYDDAELRRLVTDFYRRDLELRGLPVSSSDAQECFGLAQVAEPGHNVVIAPNPAWGFASGAA